MSRHNAWDSKVVYFMTRAASLHHKELQAPLPPKIRKQRRRRLKKETTEPDFKQTMVPQTGVGLLAQDAASLFQEAYGLNGYKRIPHDIFIKEIQKVYQCSTNAVYSLFYG